MENYENKINMTDIELLIFFIETWTNDGDVDNSINSSIGINNELPIDEFIELLKKINIKYYINDNIILYEDLYYLFINTMNNIDDEKLKKLDIIKIIYKFMIIGDYLKIWKYINISQKINNIKNNASKNILSFCPPYIRVSTNLF